MELGGIMGKRVKLENIIQAGFTTDMGDRIFNITEEYVCKNCRHLVEVIDKFCWFCGEELESSDIVEHWQKGIQLSNEAFNKIRRALEGK